MKSQSNDNKDVVAGGLLSFGISMTVILLLDFLVPVESLENNYLLRLFGGLFVYIIASFVGSFFVTYKLKEKFLINSMKSSYFGFLINTVIMLFIQTLYGLAWVFIGYTLGGVLGSIAAIVYNKRKKVG